MKENVLKYKIPLIIYFSYLFIFLLVNYLFSTQTEFYFIFNKLAFLWDGKNYINIATFGYSGALFAFLPGYPILIGLLDNIFPKLVAYNINLVISLFTLISVYKFLDLIEVPEVSKTKVLLLFISYPFSFFLFLNYTESIYILISIWALYFLIKNKNTHFVILGSLLSFFKITAVSLFILYFLNIFKQKKLSLTDSFGTYSKHLALGFTSIIGIFLYFSYLNIFYGNFNIFFVAQRYPYWNRGFFALNMSPIAIDPGLYFIRFSEFAIFCLLSYCLIKYIKKVNQEIYIFSLIHFLIPISTGTLLSLNRLSLLAFPILLVFFSDVIKTKWGFSIIFPIFIVWQVLGIYLINNLIFVG